MPFPVSPDYSDDRPNDLLTYLVGGLHDALPVRLSHFGLGDISRLPVVGSAITVPPMLDEVRALLILQDRDRRLLALAKELEKLPQD